MQPNTLRRIFFALWPDDGVRTDIKRVFKTLPHADLPGRNLSKNNFHLTLHFLGNIPQQKLDCVQRVAESVTSKSFELKLDHFGSFSKASVFWTGPSDLNKELSHLQHELGELLKACDFKPEKRPFNPHVTLKRKIKCAEEFIKHEPVIWIVNQFALVESISVESGVEYKPLKFYKLL